MLSITYLDSLLSFSLFLSFTSFLLSSYDFLILFISPINLKNWYYQQMSVVEFFQRKESCPLLFSCCQSCLEVRANFVPFKCWLNDEYSVRSDAWQESSGTQKFISKIFSRGVSGSIQSTSELILRSLIGKSLLENLDILDCFVIGDPSWS